MKRYRVEWSEAASKDLENIFEYISQDSLHSTTKIFEKIKTKCKVLGQHPYRGRMIPELKAYEIVGYHELIIAPWRIIYRISEEKVFVLAVIDSRKNIEDLLLERLLR